MTDLARFFEDTASLDADEGENASVIMTISAARSLIQTITRENEGLSQCKPVDVANHNLQKSHALLQINRLAALLQAGCESAMLRSTLKDLRNVLRVNLKLLEIQLRAARAVSEIIASAIRESSSDGTYSAQSWRTPAND